MAYADYAAYQAALARGQWFSICPANYAPSSAWASGWKNGMPAETSPTTAAVPARLSLGGSFGQPDGNWRLAKVRASGEGTAAVVIVDRLSHQGGLSGATAPAEQTTNLPTAALTRYTSGEGVQIGLEVHTSVGSTAVDVTARYTNTTPTGSRVTEAVSIGTSFRNAPGVFIPLPLQAGDTGVTSVEGVTLSATTGTAGAFGVVLYKPLTAPLPINQACDNHVDFEYDIFLRTGELPLVLSGACLTHISIGSNIEPMVEVFLIPE